MSSLDRNTQEFHKRLQLQAGEINIREGARKIILVQFFFWVVPWDSKFVTLWAE